MKENRLPRLVFLGCLLGAVLLVYLYVLYDVQVNQHETYLAQSLHSITQSEDINASRGVITDRKGRVLVSNRSVYSLTFDEDLLKDGQDTNEAILRLLTLCEDQDLTWTDSLPIATEAPYRYTLDAVSDTQKTRFLNYLRSVDEAGDLLGSYLLTHPQLLETTDEDGVVTNPADDILANAELSEAKKAAALLEALSGSALTADVLIDAGLPSTQVLRLMQQETELSAAFTAAQVRKVLGVRYELALRKLGDYTDYVLVEDVDTAFISLVNDGGYAGAKITSSSVRQYETTYAAHILGTVGAISSREEKEALGDGYSWDDLVGKSGVEAAFEEYLKGTDGRRLLSTNSDGKITGEYYAIEPEPGATVELTIDLALQQVVEDTLAETVSKMTAADGNDARGAAAVVEKVGTGEILALASYPTYDLSTYRQSEVYAQLSADPALPFYNRATNSPYAPGSTLKPLTAVAALESGVTTLTERLYDSGWWGYPGASQYGTNCWRRSGHGSLTLTSAITNSCNYFFAEMGYRLGMDGMRTYLTAFGLGEHTGIEIGDATGTLPENPQGQNLAPWAGYGQANQAYTPLQLANYVATLASGGKHCQAHLLKAVRSYDNSEVLAVGDTTPTNIVEMQDSTLEAVKKGMLGYTQPGGMVYSYFKDCIVTAGAKTGTAQTSTNVKNNGVFICFAPYDAPEIAISIVIEQGDAGANLASTAVQILNYYFSADEIGTAILGENELRP